MTRDVPARFALVEVLIHQVSSNDEVERRGDALPRYEADLSQSSTPSSAQRRRDPRSLEPIVRRYARAFNAQPTLKTYRDPPTTCVTECTDRSERKNLRRPQSRIGSAHMNSPPEGARFTTTFSRKWRAPSTGSRCGGIAVPSGKRSR